MATVPQVARVSPPVLGPVAGRAARATGCVPRTSRLTGARSVHTLAFGRLAQPQARLSRLVQAAATLGVRVAGRGRDARFSAASADGLRDVLAAAVPVVVAAAPVALPVLRRFTAAAWPGRGGGAPAAGTAAMKVSVRLDLATGRLSGPCVEAGRTADRVPTVATTPLPPGALRLADRGFFSLGGLAEQHARGVLSPSRGQPGTAVATPGGRRQGRLPPRARATTAPVDRPVLLGARRRRVRATARDQGRTVGAARSALCAWTILITSVPPAHLAVQEALVLTRARWRVEARFECGKQQQQVDEWRATNPWRILTEGHAKLLAVLVRQRLILVGCWPLPDRGLVKATQAIRGHALHLAAVFDVHARRCQARHIVARCLATGRLNARKTVPNTVHPLLALDPPALA